MIREADAPFAAIVIVSGSPLEDEHVEPPGFLTSFVESRAILHVVTKGISSAPTGSANEVMLRNLANRSGGRHLMIYSSASYQVARPTSRSPGHGTARGLSGARRWRRGGRSQGRGEGAWDAVRGLGVAR